MHKHGIKTPPSINHACIIDKNNEDTLWQDAIRKEMHNVEIDF